MTDDDIKSAIDRTRRSIPRYIEVMERLYRVDVSKDADFQKLFKGFYRVRQKSSAWYAAYFGLMEESKSRKPTFPETLDALRARLGNDAYEPSFSSKLVATLNPFCPIWDEFVLQNTGHTPPSYMSRTKHDEAKTAYASIVDWYNRFMRSSEGRRWISIFNEHVDESYRLSDIKKVDFILWQIRDNGAWRQQQRSRVEEPPPKTVARESHRLKIVIQCAASKDPAAGMMTTAKGTPVLFVADPARAHARTDVAYARPDESAEDGQTWRDHVRAYNAQPNGNAHGLLPAWRLYRHPAYAKLVERFGEANVFILSAGWGLIRADFLTPVYDITFSAQAEPFKRRRAHDAYSDFNMLEGRSDEPVAFFGAKDYLPLFCRLTEDYPGRRIGVFNSATEPQAHGVRFVRYHTRTRTNWHYEAVNAFLDGAFFAA